MHFEYFKADFRTPIESVKKQYHKLVLENHPDRGGDEEAMKRINTEWDWLKSHNYNIHESKDGSIYTNEDQWKPDDLTERFAVLINALMRLEGVGIEICGSFIWVSGNTREYKDVLRALGLKWSRNKKMWYAAPKDWFSRGKAWSMEKIRTHHGSRVVTDGFIPEHALLTA